MSLTKNSAYGLISILALAGCVHQSAIPLGNDMMEIDVSAAPVYGRAGAQRIAITNAAKSTLAMGYDKFIVVNGDGWTETTFQSGSSEHANVGPYGGSANGSSFANTLRHPESKLVIKMFHTGDKGADKAVDARGVVELNKDQN